MGKIYQATMKNNTYRLKYSHCGTIPGGSISSLISFWFFVVAMVSSFGGYHG